MLQFSVSQIQQTSECPGTPPVVTRVSYHLGETLYFGVAQGEQSNSTFPTDDLLIKQLAFGVLLAELALLREHFKESLKGESRATNNCQMNSNHGQLTRIFSRNLLSFEAQHSNELMRENNRHSENGLCNFYNPRNTDNLRIDNPEVTILNVCATCVG